MVPASILALDLFLPLTDLHSFLDGRAWYFRDQVVDTNAKNILLVDDSCGTGKSLRKSIDLISAARPGVEIVTVAAYASEEAANRVDISFNICPKPRLFEWNWHRSWKVKYCAFDIDGVICRDPTREEKHDAGRYVDFLREADPLFKPIRPVGALVTGRREMFRQDTEAWMSKNGIQYSKLKMMPGDPPRGGAVRAEFKADYYKRSPYVLFFESSPKQAEIIARLSGKDVVCIGDRNLYRA